MQSLKQKTYSCYLILANSVVLLFLFVLASHATLTIWNHFRRTPYVKGLPPLQRASYPHMNDDELNDLLRSSRDARRGGWEYAEWVGFEEAPRQSRYVNVNEHGLRLNSPTPFAMSDLNQAVWFFGGSTAFGYGVSDSETIPARLEKLLNVKVINFGRAYYYSGQENALFRDYLKGYRPKLVLFLDGLNERCDIGFYRDSMKALFRKAQRYSWSPVEIFTPVTALVGKIIGTPFDDGATGNLHDLDCNLHGAIVPLARVHEQNLAERAALCRQFDVPCKTLIQPFAGIHGKHEDFVGLAEAPRQKLKSKFEHLKPVWERSQVVWLTNVLDHYPKHAYADPVHYNAEASDIIAHAIAEKLGP